MTKLRLLLGILGLSIVLFSCGGGNNPEPLDAQAAMVGTYTGQRYHELLFNDTLRTFADTFNIVVTKGRDAKTMIFTETTATLKEKAYRYEVTLETENSNGAKLSIAEQNFEGEPLQGEDMPDLKTPGQHGFYFIDNDTKKEELSFILRIINDGVASKATTYEYFFDKQ